MELVIGNSLLLVFVIIEIMILYFYKKETIPWKEIITNLNSGHILLWVFRGLEVAAYYTTYKFFSLDLLQSLPYWAIWLLAFVLWDFCFYWLHRLHHKYSLLWGVHSVHHEGEHFSLSLGIRNSWYSSLTSFPFFLVMAVIGFPVDVFVAVASIHYFIQFYNHNHLIKKSGWLEYFMVTPAHHRVHHGKNDPYRDKNFSGTFIIWDKLFNTFQEELENELVVCGVDNVPKSNNPIIVNNAPFARLYKLKIFSMNSKKENLFVYPNWILVSSSLLLFILLLFYIYFENQHHNTLSLILFFVVFIGTIGNGLMTDGNQIGLYIWLINFTVGCILIFFQYNPNILLFDTVILACIVQTVLIIAFSVKTLTGLKKSP
ncbi:MAG: sterol desaturase family protein [Bacteroidia bacterium]|nr:sterol desaturase family protein [Bacteroidia bacterium]